MLAVKLVTGFARADSSRLARQLRTAAFVQVIASAGPATDLHQDSGDVGRLELNRLLGRPLRIPPALLAATAPAAVSRPPEPDRDNGDRNRRLALRAERDRLQATYDALLAVPPRDLELASAAGPPIEPPAVSQAVRDTDTGDGVFTGNDVAARRQYSGSVRRRGSPSSATMRTSWTRSVST